MSKMYIRELVLSSPWLKKIYLKYRTQSINDLMNSEQLKQYLECAKKVILERPVNLKVGLVKDADNYADEGLVKERAYYPKYERFLKNNNINYSYYDPYRSDWIEKAENYDLIIWHTDSDPSTQDIAKSKIYILEKMGKHCLPSYEEIWSYEDKIRAHYLYKLYKLPAIPTFVSHSKSEIIDYLKSAKYPLISKISTGSASFGVDKLDNYDQAKKVVDQVFCYKGKETYFKYSCQKDYIYFQDFIEDATYDLRVMSVGNELFGYYRYPNKGDFRASGAGNYEKKGIPNEALELAYQVKEKFGSSFLATDFVYSEKLKKFLIIESSIFIGIDTCEQLSIDGIAGKYVRISENRFEFKPGKYWVQELTLKNVIEKITK
ncbi:ATP-grasp domain-containing protein [Acinetobacter radioresistens]|uniref:ATP-grasp domain-containing protein n=1 Tax=Acinetobacter radioresistens TaxID=40216 RepID=UPI003214D66F